MGSTQKVLMFKRTPRNPKKRTYYTLILWKNSKGELISKMMNKIYFLSKSVYDSKKKNNLSVCNMAAHKARKAICETKYE
jgi:hypothetical protein